MFGWKEGIDDDENGVGEDLEKDVMKGKVAKVDEDGTRTDGVFQCSCNEVTLKEKDVSAIHASQPASLSPSESKQSYQSKSFGQTVVVTVPAKKLAPRAEVDSFSDEDLELCVEIPSYASEPAGTALKNEDVNHIDEVQNVDTSDNIDSLLVADADDSANLSDVFVADTSSGVCQQTVSKSELTANDNTPILSAKNIRVNTASSMQDSGVQTTELTTEPDTTQKTDSFDGNEDRIDVLPKSPLSPLTVDTSGLAKLDPVTRIDLLLESLSCTKLSPSSPSLLAADHAFSSSKQSEISSGLPKVPVSPSSRLDRLADTSALERSAEVSDVKDESRIVEYKVDDEAGMEHSYRVDESYASTRDKQFTEGESLSDVSFSAADSVAADTSITYRITDESSSSGTQEIATCPAALMAATEDSLSLDRLASFSFDDILSVDNENYDQDRRVDVESSSNTKAQSTSPAKPVCNGTLHDEETDSNSKHNQLHATVVDVDTGKDSPSIAMVSPSRLVDAKRRFFCEPAQPVRIDPRRVFDEIPATSSRSVPPVAFRDRTSRSISSKQVNGSTSVASEKSSSNVSSSDVPRRRVLPALPSDQPPLDVTEVVLSAEELALIKGTQQTVTQFSGKKSPQSPSAVDDSTLVRRRSHQSEKKRPSSAFVITATEKEMTELVRPSAHPTFVAKPSAVPQRQSSHSDSTADGSPGQRRERMWSAFYRPKNKLKTTGGDLASSGDTESSATADRKDKRRSLLALLMPSKNVDRRDARTKDSLPLGSQPSAPDAAAAEPSIDRAEMIAAVRKKTKSLPLEKKKSPASSDVTKRSSLEKQRTKSSKSRGNKKSETEADGRSKQQRTVYEEMAPIIEGIKRVERRNREKVNIHDRIRAVAPPPAKAPFTALLPPKADSKCSMFYLLRSISVFSSVWA